MLLVMAGTPSYGLITSIQLVLYSKGLVILWWFIEDGLSWLQFLLLLRMVSENGLGSATGSAW
ncbi:hypothetical protein RHMOL_Rhmol06G0022800 [Rhododendron molle]|uniref:Uncharacterized protein n=1 Tax=Rhododendron molle TaxID=49168 RepID=A0ACC0N7X9_RHOML|nr:hypothetical protein RHMOL_Rhmol06G0022800 [Rhododendron molle]